MADNFVQAGDRLTIEASSTVEAGDALTLGIDDIPAIALNDAVSGEQLVLATSGVFTVPIASGAGSDTDPGDPAFLVSGELTDDGDTDSPPQFGVFWSDGNVKIG